MCLYDVDLQITMDLSNKLHNVFVPSQVMTIMFEVQDLAVASPATVSRCGMVYLEPSILGLSPFVRCWLHRLPDAIKPHKDELHTLFHKFLEVYARYKKVYISHVVSL